MIDRENPKKQYFYGYIITNNINDKKYVGITSRSIKVRWNQHKTDAKIKNYYLYNSMRKHGIDNFSIKEIIRTNSWETILKWEIATIQARNTFAPNGYNLTLGGEGVNGCKHTKEQNEKKAKTSRRMWEKPGYKERH